MNESIKHKFIELRASGLSFDKISKKLGKAKGTLIQWGKDHKHEINNLKAINLEGVKERHQLLTKERVDFYGQLLQKIKEEIFKRDLSEIPTHQLISLVPKIEKSALLNPDVIYLSENVDSWAVKPDNESNEWSC